MPANLDSVVNQGEFHAKIPPFRPEEHGHAVHNKAGYTEVPESHIEVLSPGSAPKDRSFRPDTTNMFPSRDPDANIDEINGSDGDIIPGATSADVVNNFNRPIQGQTSKQLHGSGANKGKKEHEGLIGRGGTSRDSEEYIGRREHEFNKDTTGAEDKLPVGADELSYERR
ncbi:hypothetical protein B7463_g10525, partial [Scytalidium lignicola]